MTALHELTAVEQRDALRKGEVTAKELAEHYLRRIDLHAEDLGAFVHVTADLSRQEASHADEVIGQGGPPDQRLLGLPIAFKDLHYVAGVPLTMGSAAIDPIVPPADGWVVGLLRKAGVVTLGTTHAPEFGAPCYTHSDVVGRPAVTPYDTSRCASGSSGGAAAAVAAGLIPVGHGSDGAGSIRLPANVCGLVGLKPTRGRVSTAPTASFLSWVTEGPLARTVADAALLLHVMADPPANELHRRPRAGDESFLEIAQRPPAERATIAVWTDNGFCDPDPENVRAVERTAALLTDLGHTVVEVANPVPWTEQSCELFFSVFGGLAGALVNQVIAPERREKLQDFSRWLFELGERIKAHEYVAATDGLATLAAQFLASVEPYDAVLTPVTSAPPVPVGYFHAQGVDHLARRMIEWAAYTPMQNMTGLPAVSLPVHVTPEGLPVGVQLTASRHGDEALLLALGAQLEDTVRWQDRHPPQWFQ